MREDPQLSVIVCTRNRSHWLDQCLASLEGEAAAQADFEVVVVDNGSHDDTAAVVESFSARASMPVRYAYEARAGVARARNVGIGSARGPIAAFLDDDARVRAGWVDVVCAAFARSPDAAVIGGPIILAWSGRTPEWMAPSLEGWFSGLDLGTEFRELAPDESLYGANVAMRRELVLAAGGFDPRLGRVGRHLRSGEDWDMIERLRRNGRAFYEPRAIVDHVVLPERLRRRWLMRRCYAFGRNSVKLRALAESATTSRVEGAMAAARALQAAVQSPRRLARAARRSAPADLLMLDLAERAIRAGEAVAALEHMMRIRDGVTPAAADPPGLGQPVGRGEPGSSP